MSQTTELEAVRETEPESSTEAVATSAARAPAITWFEIPALDYEATVAFYEALLETKLQRVIDPEMGRYAKFAGLDEGTQGCVAPAEHHRPGSDGTVVYLWCGLDLDTVLTRAWNLGAKVVVPKRMLPHGIGAVAQIIDPQGNRVGLHARR